jgi:cephalosporin hydroxylase
MGLPRYWGGAISLRRITVSSADPVERSGAVERLVYAARASKAFATQPYEAVERFREKFAERRDERGGPYGYVATPQSERDLHGLCGARWPCQELARFDEIWARIVGELESQRMRVGRGAFGGWDDGDPQLVRLAWCLVAHLRPQNIVETGVARGLTSRALLEGMERNGSGHLWSIDLPPLLEHDLSRETAAAVPKALYGRWTLLRGSSRGVLPGLTAQLGRIDLFVHDSMHTTRNVLFELDAVWPALAAGGVALIDDVEKNAAIGQFLEAHPEASSVICGSSDGEVQIGCLVKSAAA